ncbi:AraC family transcriptional regulator [Cronobacter malonaticus]|uniref:AraC family transcriptional regulator n=1 Tax=Cronobacter malonaticus TaxID=413503 RepID=UPI000CFAD5DF|nr:AraC family transcriptional regulator [Cronobacter malonaticus]EKY3233169.1 AraC family transcriptional regulator [Cronobacter malonaticus]ELY4026204.1 AraC family transcriptional regulator [Cronobacter malonaticus]EMA8636618.1 AraC family transcriptional regulator [Cronobacter malonaticus]MDI7683746.1 AraC family transcriptional regulator [Cronobacter malonaticus]
MDTACEKSLLELISLNDDIVSFSRLYANSIRYHHWHQCLELLYVEEGYGVVMVDNQQYTMRPGRLFIFPPMTLHKVMVEERERECYRRTVIHLDNHAALRLLVPFAQRYARFATLSLRGGRATVVDFADIHEHLDHLFTLYAPRLAKGRSEHEEVASLLIHLLSLLPETPAPPPRASNALSTQVMLWVEENYAQKFSLNALAQTLNRSRSYLSRRFRQETGEAIHDYLTTFRLRKACELLRHHSHSVADIARMTGFSDTTYFISSFRKRLGETPLQYRKSRKNEGPRGGP